MNVRGGKDKTGEVRRGQSEKEEVGMISGKNGE